jgi:CheY-like chemotaxis protein
MNPGSRSSDDVKRAARRSVLLAEDLLDLQALIAMWLTEAGYDVTSVSTGGEVVQLSAQREFDLLVTDILMPGGDGWDAIAAVQQSRPQLRILAMSGGGRVTPASTALRAARAAGAIASIEKPFTRPDFLDAVGRVMATKAR